MLSIASSFEETIVNYSYKDARKAFTIDKDLDGQVLVWYEIPNIMLNHKSVVQSKDIFLWGSFLSPYQCESASTLKDASWRRPKSPHFTTLLTASGADKFRPCGLVALAMYTDTFDVYTRTGTKIALDVTDLALESDKEVYDEKFIPKGNNNGAAPPIYNMDGTSSWLSSGHFLERFQVWYRTPASPIVRQLYARIEGGLPAGQYSLNFTVNDPVFEVSWAVPEKRIIFSVSKTLGSVGACRALGIVCVLIAVLEACVTAFFLVSKFFGGARWKKTAPSPTVLTATAE